MKGNMFRVLLQVGYNGLYHNLSPTLDTNSKLVRKKERIHFSFASEKVGTGDYPNNATTHSYWAYVSRFFLGTATILAVVSKSLEILSGLFIAMRLKAVVKLLESSS